MKICIDAGHAGGNVDVGAYSPKKEGDNIDGKESIINLNVARLLRKEMLGRGYEVVMTRDSEGDEESDSLAYRVELSNNEGCELFISIHCNSAENATARGFEIFHYTGSINGQELAEIINKKVKILGQLNRGVKQANFYVLKRTDAVAVLIELGFISNREEEVLLHNSAYQIRVAKLIADGIEEYLK